MRHLKRAVQWAEALEHGDVIEWTNGNAHYLGFDQVTQAELDRLTRILNFIAETYGMSRRFTNAAGEILPTRIR